jgi:transposase, IS5 family
MRSKARAKNQLHFLAPTLKEQLNPKHELYLLSHSIDWDYFEKAFKDLYSDKGRPAHAIRLMVSLLILKVIYNLSDEKLVEEHWEMNVYFQYFSGFDVQQWGAPCAASDLVHFRQRIGEDGVEKIFRHSIDKHGKDAREDHVSIDTTAQEKNITYPTDAKLYKKIIDKCVKKAGDARVPLRRSYKRTAKQLLRATYNARHPKRRKNALAAQRKLKTIAGRLVRELERKLPDGAYRAQLELFKKVLAQEKHTKHKIYSLHEPEVYCMSKGKAHKKYEYGCKASVVLTQNTGIIVGAITFKTNRYDGHTLEQVLQQTQKLTGKTPKTATVDRGYRGKQMVGDTQINMPKPPLKKDTPYQRRKKRKHHRRRAAIEPIISHLKADHRVARNFLKGQSGDSINFMMAAAGFNFKKLMRKLKEQALWSKNQIQWILRIGLNHPSKSKTILRIHPKGIF